MVDVEVGTGGGHGNCGATRTFRITVEVVDDRAALGLSAGARFTWRLVGLARPSADPSADPTPISTPTLTSVVGPPATPTSPSGLSPSGLSPSGLSPSGLSPSGLSSSTGDGGDADLHLGPAAAPLAQTVIGVVRHPQPVLWSALAAVAFLLVQHRIDMSDPKLLGAFRTAREQMVVFPIDYRRWEES